MKKGEIPAVKIFVAAIYRDDTVLQAATQQLQDRVGLGPIDLPSDPYPFDLTDYYQPEMGAPLFRIFLPFEKPATASDIIPVKEVCLDLERQFATEGRRRINLDPGYLDLHKLVLISEKFLGHKIDIGHGMCADLTLLLGRRQVTSFQWTFPDFKTDRYHAYILMLRDRFRRQLRATGNPNP